MRACVVSICLVLMAGGCSSVQTRPDHHIGVVGPARHLPSDRQKARQGLTLVYLLQRAATSNANTADRMQNQICSYTNYVRVGVVQLLWHCKAQSC